MNDNSVNPQGIWDCGSGLENYAGVGGGSPIKCWHCWHWAVEGWESRGLEQKSKKMRPIIIKLIEFFLIPGIIPSQKFKMHQKIFLILTKSMFKNIKHGIKWSSSKSPFIQVLRLRLQVFIFEAITIMEVVFFFLDCLHFRSSSFSGSSSFLGRLHFWDRLRFWEIFGCDHLCCLVLIPFGL